MDIKKSLLIGITSLTFSLSCLASPINVGGVVWDPSSTLGPYPQTDDFTSHGSIVETIAQQPGDIVTGFGLFDEINSEVANTGDFCPSCELTFTFSMELVTFAPTTIPNLFAFSFKDLVINIFVDHSEDYAATSATSADGDLWLQLTARGLLAGVGSNLGTGSDTGTGAALLDVTGGLAENNFNTNSKANGTDFVLSSSFQPRSLGFLDGTFDLTGESIPEPTTLALFALALLGYAGSRKRAM